MVTIQQKLFTLLCEVDDICRQNDITYYLAAGCALGAVRHGGFLPWDDDVDVYITRDNWKKLRTIIYDNLPENRGFVCEEDTPLYDNPIGRYVDLDTTQMMHSQVICGECCGLVLEFFIMDPMPPDEEGKNEHRRYMRIFTEILTPYFQLAKQIYDEKQYYDYNLYCEYEKRTKTEGFDVVLKELKEKFAYFPEEGANEYCMRWGQRVWTFDAKHFGPPSYIEFEGRQFPILNYPREYFRSGYGDDWMYIPSGANKISHNLSKDLDRPFQEYVDLYLPLLDKEKIYKAFRSRKEKRMGYLLKREMLLLHFSKFKAYAATKLLRDNPPDLQTLRGYLDNNNLRAIDQELEYYYDCQFDPDVMGYSLYIDIGDSMLVIALENLIRKGQYFRAAKILKCRKMSSDEPCSEAVAETERHIDFCRSLSINTMDDTPDSDAVRLLLDEHPEYQDTLDYQKAQLWLMRAGHKNDDDLRQLLQQADQAIETFGHNGELIWYRAWALHVLGDSDAASAYQDAVDHTRNGLVWKEANDLYGIVNRETMEDEERMEKEASNEG